MINIKFKENEEKFIEMQDAINELFEVHYPHILEWNHYEMWQFSNRLYTPDDWKQFRLDPRVSEWYQSEMSMIVETRAFKILGKVGDTKSTADISALTQMLNYLKDENSGKQNKAIMVYTFIPLNVHERSAPNVRVLETVPVEIQNAIQFLQGQGDEQEG